MGIKDGDLGEKFPSNSNGSFFVTRKCDGIELYQPQNATKFSIFFLEGSLALVIHTNVSENFVRFCKSGGKGMNNGTVHPGGMCAMPDICIFDMQLQCVRAHCSVLLCLTALC